MIDSPDDLLTTREAAAVLRVSTGYLKRLKAAGALAHVKFGRRLLFRRAALSAFAQRRELPAR